jgi:tetratricopeptide (TPR) repeat protein
MAETREVKATGKYVMGDLDSKQDAKRLALLEAKRLALEECGTYLESLTEVKEFNLAKDEISSLAAGIINVKIVDDKWEMKGESVVLTIAIEATVDTSDLNEKISSFQESRESIEETEEIKKQLADLQEEIQQLKERQTQVSSGEEQKAIEEEVEKRHQAVIDKAVSIEHLEAANRSLINRQPEKAVEDYDRLLAIDSNDARTYAARAIALHRIGKPREALADIEKAISLAPRSSRAHATKANILLKMKRFNLAVEAFNRAIFYASGDSQLYFRRGQAYLGLRKPARAGADFKRSCDMGFREGCQKAKALARRHSENRAKRDKVKKRR